MKSETVMIDFDGFLIIQRGGGPTMAYCPFSSVPGDQTVRCGTWCPLFRVSGKAASQTAVAMIHLDCGKGGGWPLADDLTLDPMGVPRKL